MIIILFERLLTSQHFVFTVPAILSEAIPATSQKVQNEIDATLEMAYKFTGKSWQYVCYEKEHDIQIV